jgi:hypothetical protein
MTPKQVVQQLLETLPDACTYEDIKRHIERFEIIRSGQEATMQGALASFEIERWPKQ